MEFNQQAILESTIHELGYNSVNDFALASAKKEIEQQINDYKKEIEVYETKYGMNYKTFCEQFHALKQWDMFEKEDDSMMWETYVEMYEIYKKQLQKLV